MTKSLKHVMVFEEFDVDKFLEDPEAEFAKNVNNPEIEEGDYVESYRGKGQVLSFDGDFAIVKLDGQNGPTVKVPRANLKKSAPTSIDGPVVDTKEELSKLSKSVQEYVDFLEENPDTINLKSATEFLQDVLVDCIDLQKKDRNVINAEDFQTVWQGVVNVAGQVVEIDPGMKPEIDAILSKFEEMETIR